MKLTHTLGMASALLVAQTQAHVSMLAPENIAQGQSFKAVVAIPHGCDGSATTAVTIICPLVLLRSSRNQRQLGASAKPNKPMPNRTIIMVGRSQAG